MCVGSDPIHNEFCCNAAGFARAEHVRPFVFPDDQGPHPEYQTEWWYYTGNLETSTGRHFGYQLTFFRRALTPSVVTRASDWATNQIYFAHFAVTDRPHGRWVVQQLREAFPIRLGTQVSHLRWGRHVQGRSNQHRTAHRRVGRGRLQRRWQAGPGRHLRRLRQWPQQNAFCNTNDGRGRSNAERES